MKKYQVTVVQEVNKVFRRFFYAETPEGARIAAEHDLSDGLEPKAWTYDTRTSNIADERIVEIRKVENE